MSDAGEPLRARTLVFVCHGPSCTERGNPENCRVLRERLADSPARLDVRVCETTCLDNCATGPNVIVSHEGHVRSGVQGEALQELLGFLLGEAPDRARPA